jgi:hypothetical protein
VRFVTGAEKLLPHHRAAIETVFGRPVHERYGSRDAGLIGFQTDPERSLDFEVDWANLLVEPETRGGVSSVLVTRLHADGMPMLRYRIGDRARFPEDARPGWPALVLHEVAGRETDRVWLPAGGWVDGLAFPHLMKDHPVRAFQIVQAADFSVAVRLVPRAGYTGETGERIRALVAANVRGVEVRVQVVDEIAPTRSGKWRPVLTEAVPPAEWPADERLVAAARLPEPSLPRRRRGRDRRGAGAGGGAAGVGGGGARAAGGGGPPGARVLVKPNWVSHHNQGTGGFEPLVTHGSLVRAVAEAALRAAAGRVLVGDAPLQGATSPSSSAAPGWRDGGGAGGAGAALRGGGGLPPHPRRLPRRDARGAGGAATRWRSSSSSTWRRRACWSRSPSRARPSASRSTTRG